MKKAHARSLMARLMRLWPKGFPANMDDMEVAGRVDDLLEALSGYDYKSADRAITELSKTQTFLPSIAEIVTAIEISKAADEAEAASKVLEKFTDEDGYRYERVDGRMVCVGKPRDAYVPKDEGLRQFLEEKRRIYAEVGAPKHYTMKQVRELAAKQGRQLPEQNDQLMLSRILGGKP